MNLSGLDFILWAGSLQGALLSTIFYSKRNSPANRVFGTILLLMTIMLLGRSVLSRFPASWPRQLGLAVDSIIFVFSPLVLLYLKIVFYNVPLFKTKYLWHLVPFFLHLIGVGYMFTYSNSLYRELMYSGQLDTYFRILGGSAIAQNLIYLFISLAVLNRITPQPGSVHIKRVIWFIKGFLALTLVCIICWLYAYLNYFLNLPEINFFSYNIIWICIPFIMFFVSYYAMLKPDVFNNYRIRTNGIAIGNEKSIDEYKTALDQLMVQEKIYLDPDLSLPKVSRMLSCNVSITSNLINRIHNSNFSNFVNKYRIEEFISRVKNREHLNYTIFTIALEVGFNSKSTFNKAFKNYMKETPSEYIKRLSE